jgi:hypothetical protein
VTWIPGWNSAAAAGLWGNIFFWAGIIALLFLGVSEVVPRRYGERKDELVSKEQAATDRRQNEEMARLRVETAKANERAAEANDRAQRAALALEKYKAPRRLTSELKSKLLMISGNSSEQLL